MKKILSCLLALTLCFALPCVAFARYNAINGFSLTGDVGGTSVYVEATVDLNGAYPSETVLTLQRSTNGGRSFSNYKTLARKESNRVNYMVIGEERGLSSNYVYRVKAELFVYDNNGAELDYDYAYLN